LAARESTEQNLHEDQDVDGPDRLAVFDVLRRDDILNFADDGAVQDQVSNGTQSGIEWTEGHPSNFLLRVPGGDLLKGLTETCEHGAGLLDFKVRHDHQSASSSARSMTA
jgi:hypothetical protein